MKRTWLGVALGAALLAGTAWAVQKGGTLYVKSNEAKLLDKADAKGKEVGKMKLGQQVIWHGASPDNKMFHEVEAGKKKGFTLQQNLTPNQPAQEIATSDGKKVDAQAFASSGAATRALSSTALAYSKEKGSSKEELMKQLDAASRGIITAESVAETVKLKEAQEYGAKSTGGGK